ncbi:hypothetical protein N8467_00590 [bacterium]|jgi:hypothetical protein|nr:hypothetical protein [bacterium]
MKIKINKKLEEMSSVGGGAMQGFTGSIQNIGSHKKEKKDMRIEETEQLMREYIRNKIRNKLHEQLKEEEEQEHQLRLVIRGLIKEAKENANPHPNTGINKLRDSFRKAKATIKSKFQQLTTDPEQRKTFRSHFLNSFEKLYRELDALNAKGLPEEKPQEDEMGLQAPPDESSQEAPDFSILEEILKEVKVDLQSDEVEEDAPDEQTKKDFERKKKKDQEKEYYSPEIDDSDTTGRNQAFDTFRLVQSYFSDAYLDLDNEDDKLMFKNWCMYNLDLLLKNYEGQLSATPEDPNIENPEGV